MGEGSPPSLDKHRRLLAAGEWLFREGDPGDTAFVIEHGLLEVCREPPAGERLAQLGPGDVIGEMSLIDQLPRTASAFARVPTRLRVLTRKHLDDKLADADPLLRVLLKMILQRYRSVSAGTPPAPVEGPDRDAVLRRIELEHELEEALEKRQFELNYQPIVHLNGLSTAGFEALVRWRSPRRGLVPPIEFIPVIEQSHLIHEVGSWILREGCAALCRLRQACRPGQKVFMNVNLSGRQLASPQLYEDLKTAVMTGGIEPGELKLEITESMLMNNLDVATELLDRCRSLGVRIALDDFGTGYSSLGYLRRLPVHTIKVDRSFVAPVLQDAGSGKILRAISALAHSLGMNLVAEGIETQDQAMALSALGFEYGQGYLFSKAVPEAQAAVLLGSEWPWAFERRRAGRT